MQHNVTQHNTGASDSDQVVIDPQRAIVDPHVHLWSFGSEAPTAPFFIQECVNTIYNSGHNVTHTVFVECNTMYRRDGPDHLKSVGETEFAVGMAAMSASGLYGDCHVAAGIVANVNLQLGAEVEEALAAHHFASNGRLRGVRCQTAYAEAGLFHRTASPDLAGLMLTKNYRNGARQVHASGLSLDVWCVYSQLTELIKVADCCQDGLIVLNHLGSPFNFDSEAKEAREVRETWRNGIEQLARRQHVVIKLGGIGMDPGRPFKRGDGNTDAETLATTWHPFIETCIEAFGCERCMFESNFPVDRGTCDYRTLWNTFKLITANYSEAEKNALFSDTAKRVYKL
jgi:predicted TIM-barrel fold metal-dependent hydrolase